MPSTSLHLAPFADPSLRADDLLARVTSLREHAGRRLAQWMGYYRNPRTDLHTLLPYARSASLAVRPYRQYQERGLPTRITGFRQAAQGAPVLAGPIDTQRKEVVVENDIAWRLDTMVDFVAGQMPAITSRAADPAKNAAITAALAALFAANGGPALLQQIALLGAIHGTSYVVVHPAPAILAALATAGAAATTPSPHRPSPDGTSPDAPSSGSTGLPLVSPEDPSASPAPAQPGMAGSDDTASPEVPSAPAADAAPLEASDPAVLAAALRLVTVEASRVLPMFDAAATDDAATMRYCLVLAPNAAAAAETPKVSTFSRIARWLTGNAIISEPMASECSFELYGPRYWQQYRAGALADQGENPLGFVPVAAYFNSPLLPALGDNGVFDAACLSDVEPLIPLQDELNTRLSDRAHRITMQSFKMYLGRGIEQFTDRPVGPGQMWATDNPNASILSFGGDEACPSEDNHISEIREALDKASGVSRVAAGVLHGRVGHLSSAVALRLTLIALLARTEKKRAALTRTLESICRMALAILNDCGALPTTAAERAVDIHWPSALPENQLEELQIAQAKVNLGIPRDVVLRELGYEPNIG